MPLDLIKKFISKPVVRLDNLTNDTELEFDLLPSLVGYHLRGAQISVFNDFVKTTSGAQITPGQFGVLTIIAANPGLSRSALARAMGIERSTMVAVIDALESRGIVERRASPSDRRSCALVLSSDGIELPELLKHMVLEHENRIAADLSREECELPLKLLSRLTRGIV